MLVRTRATSTSYRQAASRWPATEAWVARDHLAPTPLSSYRVQEWARDVRTSLGGGPCRAVAPRARARRACRPVRRPLQDIAHDKNH